MDGAEPPLVKPLKRVSHPSPKKTSQRSDGFDEQFNVAKGNQVCCNRVYEVLARKRSLTLTMIRKLYKRFGIPAEVLISQE